MSDLIPEWSDAPKKSGSPLAPAGTLPQVPSAGNSSPGAGKRKSNWEAMLLRAPKGLPFGHEQNVIIALTHALEWDGALGFDEFQQKVTLHRPPPWDSNASFIAGKAVPEDFDVRVAAWCQGHFINTNPSIAYRAIGVVARERRYHPVKDYLGALEWDRRPQLDAWASYYLGVEDSPYARAVAARWMISAVARIYRPGVKADHVLVLEGSQGLLKSTALRVLGEPWYTDEISDLGSKDAAMQTAGIWIIEISELASMSHGQVGKIKDFLTRTTDRFRPPYGRSVVEQPRQCVFAGSVNLDQYLHDETGARRFWPLGCVRIDVKALQHDRDQLWAEAKMRYEAGNSWWLHEPGLIGDAADEQEGRRQADPWQAKIEDYTQGKPYVTVREILYSCLRVGADQYGAIDVSKWQQRDANRVAACLRALKWKREQVRDGKKREWVYVTQSDADDDSGASPVSPV